MVHRSLRVLLVLVVAATAVVVIAVPASAKLPPFTVSASPSTVDVGEPVTVEIALRDPGAIVPANADDLGPELGNMLSMRAVLPSGTPDATHRGEMLSPQRVSSSVWQATYIPRRAGEFAIVTFDNVVVDPKYDAYAPAPVPITVREPKPAAAGAAAPAVGNVTNATSASASGTVLWLVAGGVVALVVGLASFGLSHRRRTTRARVA
jgi:hypothetical protein